MKKYLLLFVLIFIATDAQAQLKDLYIYGEAGFGLGFFSTVKLGLNGIYKKYCFGLTYYRQSSMFNKFPGDARWPEDQPYIFPRQHLRPLCLTAGWVVTPYNEKYRCLLRGGIGYGTFYDPQYSKVSLPGVAQVWTSITNYFVYNSSKPAPGILLDPTLEFLRGRYVGYNLSFWCYLNTSLTTYGGEFDLIFGKLRNRLKHPKVRYRVISEGELR